MEIKKVVVAGGGVLGSQIAFQAAYCGFDVTIWLRSESSKTRTQPKLDQLKVDYMNTIAGMQAGKLWAAGIADSDNFNPEECIAKTERAHASVKLETSLAEAVKDADLIIESMAEVTDQKIAFYKMMAPLLEEKTVVVTNSSTLLPSTFAKYTGRPEKYCSLHFANYIWKNNTAEVMSHNTTKEDTFNSVMAFAEQIRMFPLPLHKEKNGYLLNSLLVPFLLSGMDLVANGISDPASVDAAWVKGTGAPRGPFQVIDVVGLQTAYNIVSQYQKVPGLISPLLKKMMLPYNFKGIIAMLKSYMDAGKMGRASGEGFYKYKSINHNYNL